MHWIRLQTDRARQPVDMQNNAGNGQVLRGYFVTGTDTSVGKTLITAGFLQAVANLGQRTLGLKPVAAGWVDSQQVNRDVLDIQAAASVHLATESINPVSLASAIAPHIAAEEAGLHIDVAELVRHCRQVCRDEDPEFVAVEGAGGWRVPLNHQETMVDFCVGLGFPVIVVVGMRLGCLNHALLTVESIHAAGLQVAGWVANHIDPEMPASAANLATLTARISAPLLGNVPYLGVAPNAEEVIACLHPEMLIGEVA